MNRQFSQSSENTKTKCSLAPTPVWYRNTTQSAGKEAHRSIRGSYRIRQTRQGEREPEYTHCGSKHYTKKAPATTGNTTTAKPADATRSDCHRTCAPNAPVAKQPRTRPTSPTGDSGPTAMPWMPKTSLRRVPLLLSVSLGERRMRLFMPSTIPPGTRTNSRGHENPCTVVSRLCRRREDPGEETAVPATPSRPTVPDPSPPHSESVDPCLPLTINRSSIANNRLSLRSVG